MNPHLKSILEEVIQKVYQSKTADEAKSYLIPCIRDCKIKETDKQKMLYELGRLNSLRKIQFYATNAMFKFEGLGVS